MLSSSLVKSLVSSSILSILGQAHYPFNSLMSSDGHYLYSSDSQLLLGA